MNMISLMNLLKLRKNKLKEIYNNIFAQIIYNIITFFNILSKINGLSFIILIICEINDYKIND